MSSNLGISIGANFLKQIEKVGEGLVVAQTIRYAHTCTRSARAAGLLRQLTSLHALSSAYKKGGTFLSRGSNKYL